MERNGNIIYFDGEERSVAGLPMCMAVDEVPGALVAVGRLRDNCGASISELASEDIHEAHQLHQVKAISQFTERYNRLEAISRGLGGLIAQDLDDQSAEAIINSWVGDIPGLALDRLHQE